MIPQIIHFILLNKNEAAITIDRFRPILTKYPSMSLWLWVLPEGDNGLQDNTSCVSPPCFYKCISSEMLHEFTRYEIEQVNSNIIAFRNILRYEILYQFGGIYLDERFSIKNINEHYFSENTEVDQLYVDLTLIADPLHSNQTIICTQHHPVLNEIIQQVIANYSLSGAKSNDKNINLLEEEDDEDALYFSTLENMNLPHEVAYSYEDWHKNSLRQLLTQNRSGNYCLQSIVRKLHDKNNRPLASTGATLGDINQIINFSSDDYDLRASLIETISIDHYQERLLKTILFEAKHFCIFRLDDHLFYLINYIKMNEEDAVVFLKDLFAECIQKGLELNNIICIKITYLYPSALEWCKSIDFNKCYLLPGIHNVYLAQNTIQFDYYKTPVTCAFNINQYKMCYQLFNKTPEKETLVTLEKLYASHAAFLHDIVKRCENLLSQAQNRPGTFSFTIESYLQHVIMILNQIFEIHNSYPMANAFLAKNPHFQLLENAKQNVLNFAKQNHIMYKSYSL